MFMYVKYEDGLKEAINVDRIENFDIKNIDFEKKYKIKWDDGNYYNGIIGKIQRKAICAESKEEVEEKIKGNKRVEFSPFTLCDTATDFETDSELERSHNCSAQKQDSNGSDMEKKIEKLQKENEYLRSQKIKLKKQLENKEAIITDLMTLNINLQKKVILEYTEMSKINKEVDTKVLSNFDELLHVVSKYFKKNPTCPQEQVGLPPIGYENKARNEVHLGFDVYIPKSTYDSVLIISKTLPQLIKNLAVAVYGIKVLKESTVTGIVSNRRKKSGNAIPRPALDPTKLKAIRATAKYYLRTQHDLDEVSIDIEFQHFGTHIAHKICELNRTPQSISLKNKQEIKAALCTVAMTDTNNDSEKAQYTENISDSEIPCEVSQASNEEGKTEEKNNEEKESENEINNDYSPSTDSIYNADESSDSN